MNQQHLYWHGRWQRGETGWHQSEVEPELIENFKDVKPTRVLVPLCGKSMDMTWLLAQGHDVVGVELNEGACKAFFAENDLSPQVTTEGPFKIFSAEKITIYCGDFFEFKPELLKKFGGLYDRAALIALPPDLRVKYTEHIKELIKACAQSKDFSFLQLIYEKVPNDLSGPPFSVTQKDVETYYKQDFQIQFVKREELEGGSPDMQIYQSVFKLKPLSLKGAY